MTQDPITGDPGPPEPDLQELEDDFVPGPLDEEDDEAFEDNTDEDDAQDADDADPLAPFKPPFETQ